ncbi:DDHD-domain-containing protein [Polychaeton citri CBS 116435]|uniref:DDHD-domain-containing protein n=1 Tax=Polychaeton citri CBS 116435 TaxID=1314669 RepID=A0A9P4QAF6_9PEZI|nr:DDHD-domain-containing protein [Polychaeton citri CBS 116435]
MSTQDNASFLSSGMGRFSPWTRSPVIPPSTGKDGEPESVLQRQKGADHKVNSGHRVSSRFYPKDCPPMRVQWFHAVDAPKRRPNPAGERREEKPPGVPKKYVAFSTNDSKSLETAFQKLADVEDEREQNDGADLGDFGPSKGHSRAKSVDLRSRSIKVPVNEDYLFDVDIEKRELGPAYWLGPVYEVRRATWFFQDGSVQRPCDENLAHQLELGYLKVGAWRLPSPEVAKSLKSTKPRSASQPRSRPTSWAPGQASIPDYRKAVAGALGPKGSNPDLRSQAEQADGSADDNQKPQFPNTHRLFGAHMNSVVTYQDGTTAWILTDDFLSRMSSTMYQRVYGGGHFAGTKVTRGYVDSLKKVDAKDGKENSTSKTDDKKKDDDPGGEPADPEERHMAGSQRLTLQRQMSSLLEDPSQRDPAKQEEELRRRDEKEIEDDYRETEGEDQGREIEHLLLVTHGIGQRLGLRLESVNFVHDVNTFRKCIKGVYVDSPDLRALNAELDAASKTNCRVQVLPICWRHLLEFPKQSLKHNRKEHDLADSGFGEEEDYPNLDDITVDGVPAVRNIISDLALDILLYQSPAYKDHISRIVLQECNRIYHLFCERNPNFKGKVSLVGHSLGSAIMFDILCRQDQHSGVIHSSRKKKGEKNLILDFDVEDFYALGSPIGLFQMLHGRTIAARDTGESRSRALSSTLEDPFGDSGGTGTAPPLGAGKSSSNTEVPAGEIPASRPKCAQLFNIFHPTDPISYRIEPLISPSMSTLKPQPLPYTKRGIFGAPVGQGFSGIGARVGQSVSSLWSSMSSGIASSLLTRGLGYAGDETGRLQNGPSAYKSNAPLSLTNSANNGATGPSQPRFPQLAEGSKIEKIDTDKLATGAQAAPQSGQHPPTLIDGEIETLFSGYEKRRKSTQSLDPSPLAPSDSEAQAEAEERGKRLRREEEKVRRLNTNGRVDYAIQEGAFDINLLAAIASHLSYWADEDVSHFMISQLLSRGRVVRSRAGSNTKI